MATKVVSKNKFYGNIERGTSLTIPVAIKDIENKAIDLTDLTAVFTIKKVQYDFDRYDDYAYVKKQITPTEPLKGTFNIELTSQDTDFEPDRFFFDIELIHNNGMVYRICKLEFDLVGGPTNRTVNDGTGQMPIGNEITIISLATGDPIIIIAPMVALSSKVIHDLEDALAALTLRVEDLESKI